MSPVRARYPAPTQVGEGWRGFCSATRAEIFLDVRALAPVLPEGPMSLRARRGLSSAALFAAVVGSFLGVSGLAGPARAQQLTNAPIDLLIFRPAMDSKGFITLNSSAVLGQLDTSFGLVVTYARRPLRFEGMLGTQKTSFSVDNVVTPSLQGAIGFTKLPHLG